MRPVAVYSALRLGLFLGALLLLRLVGVGGVLSLVIALVLSMLLSFVVLRRQRDAVTLALMDRKKTPKAPRRPRRSLSDRLAEDAAVEDAAVADAAVDGSTGRATGRAAADRSLDQRGTASRNDGGDRQ